MQRATTHLGTAKAGAASVRRAVRRKTCMILLWCSRRVLVLGWVDPLRAGVFVPRESVAEGVCATARMSMRASSSSSADARS